MHATSLLPGLSPVAGKSLTTARDAANLSSNGGAVVLREAAHRLGLARATAGPLPDKRNPLLVTHTYADMVMARMVATSPIHSTVNPADGVRMVGDGKGVKRRDE
jgi:Transposase DDE domain group 1